MRSTRTVRTATAHTGRAQGQRATSNIGETRETVAPCLLSCQFSHFTGHLGELALEFGA
jgi:hypothetical protein